jgi:hypothetical protein
MVVNEGRNSNENKRIALARDAADERGCWVPRMPVSILRYLGIYSRSIVDTGYLR